MATMKSVHAVKDKVDVVDVERRPVPGPEDALRGMPVEHRERFAKLISHRVPFSEVGRACELALTPGAAEKVVVTFDEASHL
ncbi:hypothetical protein ACGFXB_32900 [Streptomyces canus]|uniref:hypothetical protein n=1 Tax=Streptomyces canus TaxID=58343 RepID=UPI00371FD16A